MNYYLICYDISDDAKRQKTANELIAFGCIRVQQSVFAGALSDPVYRALIAWLKKFHQEALQPTDSVLILSNTHHQLKSALTIGPAPPDWDMLTHPPNTLII